MKKISVEEHNVLVGSYFLSKGYDSEECDSMVRICQSAAAHGIKSHNAVKAIHLEQLFGSEVGGCIPGARINKVSGNFSAIEIWDSNKKLGPSVAYEAISRCMEIAATQGIGMVIIKNCWHYLWGGGYMLEVAKNGFIGYTNCTAMLAEVVPFKGKKPTMGTNPHSWAFPSSNVNGFDILIDWATSVISMGKLQSLVREGNTIPQGAAVDAEGNYTTDPKKAVALATFGFHKGYGLSLVNEIFGALGGGPIPTARGKFNKNQNQKDLNTTFCFQVINPAIFGDKKDYESNLKKVIADILGEGNELCILPGQLEYFAFQEFERDRLLTFTDSEYEFLKKHSNL